MRPGIAARTVVQRFAGLVVRHAESDATLVEVREDGVEQPPPALERRFDGARLWSRSAGRLVSGCSGIAHSDRPMVPAAYSLTVPSRC